MSHPIHRTIAARRRATAFILLAAAAVACGSSSSGGDASGAAGTTSSGGSAGTTSSGGAAGTTSAGGSAGTTSAGGSAGTTSAGGSAGTTSAGGAAGKGGSGASPAVCTPPAGVKSCLYGMSPTINCQEGTGNTGASLANNCSGTAGTGCPTDMMLTAHCATMPGSDYEGLYYYNIDPNLLMTYQMACTVNNKGTWCPAM